MHSLYLPIKPTDDQVGRDVSYAPDTCSHLEPTSRRARLIEIIDEKQSRIQFYKLRSTDLTEETLIAPNEALIWFYPVPDYQRDYVGLSDGFSVTAAYRNRILSPSDLDDAAQRLFDSGNLTDDDTGERYTLEQIKLAMWVWINRRIDSLTDYGEDYVFSDGDAFIPALQVIGQADRRREPDENEDEEEPQQHEETPVPDLEYEMGGAEEAE